MQTHLTVKGLVLRNVAYGETSLLFDLLTDSGIRSVCAQGIRKAGSKYAALTQLFTYGEYCLRVSGDRCYLDSAVQIKQFFGYGAGLEELALASYFSELVRKTATEQPQPQILRLFLHCLHYLTDRKAPRDRAQIKGIFELRLMTELGFAPNLICCAVCMTYLPEEPVMRIGKADFVCTDCIEELPHDALPVSQSALQAIRHVVFSDFDRVFAFRVSGDSAKQFAMYAERYLRHCLDIPLPTLQYYHDLTELPPPN